MSLDIAIVINPGDSDAKLDRIERKLEEVEKAGVSAGDGASKGIEKIGTAAEKAGAKTGEFGKGMAQLGKGMAMQRMHEIAMSVGQSAVEASGGIIDLNNALLGFQAAGPAGAVAGAFAGAAFKALDENISDLSETMSAMEVSSRGLMNSVAGINFDRLNQDILKVNGSMAGLALEAAQATQALTGIIHAQTIMGLSAVDARFASMAVVLAKAKIEIDGINGVMERTYGPQKHYHEEIDKINQAHDLGLLPGHKFEEALHEVEMRFGHVTAAAQAAHGSVRNFVGAMSLDKPSAVNAGWESAAVFGKRSTLGAAADTTVRNEYGAAQDPFSSAGLSGLLAEKLTKNWQDELAAYEKAHAQVKEMTDLIGGSLVDAGKQFSTMLVDAANGADVSWSSFFENMLKNLEQVIVQAMVLKALTGSVSGAEGAHGFGGLLGAIGFSSGGDMIPRAALGADWMVGGKPGTDQNLAMFRVSKGESIHVRTAEQRQAAQQGGTPVQAGPTVIQNVFDRRALLPALNSPDGKQAILNVIRENPGAVRSLINK